MALWAAKEGESEELSGLLRVKALKGPPSPFVRFFGLFKREKSWRPERTFSFAHVGLELCVFELGPLDRVDSGRQVTF